MKSDQLAVTIPQAVQIALGHQRAGRYAEAETMYRQVLTVDPSNFDALHLLGVLAHQVGKHRHAIEFISQAIQQNPSNPFVQNNLGEAYRALGRPDEALACYRRALELKPDYATAHSNLGNVFKEQGKLDEALACYRRALNLKPDYADAHSNLGAVFQKQGKLDEALACNRRALELKPDLAEAHNNLGNVLQEQGKLDEALACYRRALELKPDYAMAHNNLGNVCQAQGKLDEALVCYRRALELNPDFAMAHNNLAAVFKEQGKLDEALVCCRRALELKPDYAEARWAFTMFQLPVICSSDNDTRDCRTAFARELAKLDDWFGPDEIKDGFKAVGSQQPFYLAYQEENNRDLLSRYGAICNRLMRHWQQSQGFKPSRTVSAHAIRVGIISAHFRDHSVWNALVKGWLQHLDRSRFELHLFHLGTAQDQETSFANSIASRFVHGKGSLRQWIEAILDPPLDVLIYPEIGMDPMTVKLASARLAPVQAATWGHPETTGLPTIDYFLSAEDLEPDNAQDNYTERLVKLPNLGCCYQPLPVIAEDLDLVRLGINPEFPILLCPGTPFKYAPQHDRVLTEIAIKLGQCQFVFFTHRVKGSSELLQQRLKSSFARAGLQYDDYVVSIPWLERPAFYGLMKRADAYLDTIGFSGFNTAMQAVECGLPIVAREGRFMRGRLASGILKRMGLSELVATSEEDYIAIAVRLAQDAECRRSMRERIVETRHILHDDPAPVRALEEFLINASRQR